MRENIFPTWEDPDNREGYCLSFKISGSVLREQWIFIVERILTEDILKDYEKWNEINGLSISPKKEFNICKIWFRTYDKNPPTYIKEYSPYFIHSKDNPLMNYCGLYSIWMDNNFQSVLTFTIITIEANNTLSKIHHRMPVILDEGNESRWLDPNNNFQSVKEFINPIEDSKIDMYQIDLNYNNNN